MEDQNQREIIALVVGLLGTTSLPSDSRIDDVLLVAAAIQTKIRLGSGDPLALENAKQKMLLESAARSLDEEIKKRCAAEQKLKKILEASNA